MFLSVTRRRNPRLIQAATALHREGTIAANTYVLDLDSIEENAGKLKKASDRLGLNLYLMTKQIGRNPLATHASAACGLDKVVAVDVDEADTLYRAGVSIGHVGHLAQVPLNDLNRVLAMRPEVVTVFSVDKARQISNVCRESGQIQDLLIRVIDEEDYFHPGQEGGIPLAGLVESVHQLSQLSGVRVVGVTSFPCLVYNYESQRPEFTHNLRTLLDASQLLRNECGLDVRQINAPGASAVATFPMLRAQGVTHAEPGSALIGHTPMHAFDEQPEYPAMVYVSEVTHINGNKAYCVGGGFYARSRVAEAVVGVDPDDILDHCMPVLPLPAGYIDYYGTLLIESGDVVHVGDTVVFAFRSQVFTTRSKVAVVSGLRRGRPSVVGQFDSMGRRLLEHDCGSRQ